MAGPIQPNAGSVPLPSQGSQQTSEKLQGEGDKIGVPASQEVTKASVSKVTATVKQSLIKKMELETLLRMAPPVRNIILTDLTEIELDAFEIALSKGTAVQEKYQATFKVFKGQIDQIRQKRNELLLKEILADHPEWKSQVEAWKDVSLVDKIWLLQLCELRNLDVEIPQINAAPSAATISLLESSTKKVISEALSKITELKYYGKGLQKCPKAIGLLVNLQKLHLQRNMLTVPPDVSRNIKLQVLKLNTNPLTVPPDVSRNVNLQVLMLIDNKLTVPPDVSRNVNLQELYLVDNQLTAPPDVSRNVNLQTLSLAENKLTAPPDVSQNVNLKELVLRNNPLTAEAKETLANLKSERTNLAINF